MDENLCHGTVDLWPGRQVIPFDCKQPMGHDGRHVDGQGSSWLGEDPDTFEWADS